MSLYSSMVESARAGRKTISILIDPDKYTTDSLTSAVKIAAAAGVDYFLIGGSLLVRDTQAEMISVIRENSDIPVILFPGNQLQLNGRADGILLLSLISGRNPDLLIGRHVISAPYIKASNLEVISTGYMLIESGSTTTVTYMSNTLPIPAEKNDIAVCTAMAGEMLGMKAIYLDAGSGARNQVPAAMITRVRKAIGIPLIVGGGITSAELAKAAFDAGADMVVAGNAVERDPGLIEGLAKVARDA